MPGNNPSNNNSSNSKVLMKIYKNNNNRKMWNWGIFKFLLIVRRGRAIVVVAKIRLNNYNISSVILVWKSF